MITEAKFKYALKSMMETMPLEDINVTALCEKCKCHRQTFYYHYQDIYDLIAAIFLNEDLTAVTNAKDTKKTLTAFLSYAKSNFSFLRSTYNSAGRDLTDDFIYGKINAKLFTLWVGDEEVGLKKEGVRNAARRFSRLVADEFGFYLKDQKLTPERFVHHMNKFIDHAINILLPAVLALSKKEEAK